MNRAASLHARLLGWVLLLALSAALWFACTVGPFPVPLDDNRLHTVETSLPEYDTAIQTIHEPEPAALLLTRGSAAAGGVTYRVNTAQKVLAFTFDLDMTPGMLQLLQSGRVR